MSEVVRYQAGDSTEVLFEIDPPEGYRPVGRTAVAGRIRDAVLPAVEAASEVLRQLKALQPDGVEVKFGIKVSGSANWLIAKAASEGSFEVTMTWRPDDEGTASLESPSHPPEATSPTAVPPPQVSPSAPAPAGAAEQAGA